MLLVRRCGGIGIHARLKIVWGNPCRFKSDQRHHVKADFSFKTIKRSLLNGFLFECEDLQKEPDELYISL